MMEQKFNETTALEQIKPFIMQEVRKFTGLRVKRL
jgi:hypothetical protein